MNNKLEGLLQEIRRLEKELYAEIQKKEKEFFYNIRGKRVYFEEAVRKYHKTLVVRLPQYILGARLMNVISMPVIWFGIFPAVLMDLFITIYQAICFRIYRIPPVSRGDHVVIDRHALTYLNIIEKANCVYCSYFNGLASYMQEVAARTEQHWCPIKHARKLASVHKRYGKFVEYGDAEGFRERFDSVRQDFEDLQAKDS